MLGLPGGPALSSQWSSTNPFLVLIGAPGSGKSAWASKYFTGPEIVSSDRIRAMIGDHSGDQRANEFTFRALHAIVDGRIALGKTVVVDATNRTREQRGKITQPAIAWHRPAIAVVFLTPLEVCLERNARRREPRRVPEKWVRETHAMIETDFNPAITWMAEQFFGGTLFVNHDGPDYVGGPLNRGLGKVFEQAAWLDNARETPPEWWHGPEKYPGLRPSAWESWGRERPA